MTQDCVTYSTVLAACANLKLVEVAQEVYNHFHQSGLPKEDIYVHSAMLHVYATSGDVNAAASLFTKMKSFSISAGGMPTVACNIMMKLYLFFFSLLFANHFFK